MTSGPASSAENVLQELADSDGLVSVPPRAPKGRAALSDASR
jgi:hypothetical protein